jgi:hypothetical protein
MDMISIMSMIDELGVREIMVVAHSHVEEETGTFKLFDYLEKQ